MKEVSLNIWGGKVYEPLMHFFKDTANEIDVFCLQEVFHTHSKVMESRGARVNILNEIAQVLKNYHYFFHSLDKGFDYEGEVNFDLSFGQAIFTKDNVSVIKRGAIPVYEGVPRGVNPEFYNHPRLMQYINILDGDKPRVLGNLHGVWVPYGKDDNPARLEQSRRVKEFFDKQEGGKILAGDLNLNPYTKSLAVLEEEMRNLIKEYGITSTRSKYHTRGEKYADYILTSKDVYVKDFKVIEAHVSDHLPLYTEFE